jgi:hypothetical protein
LSPKCTAASEQLLAGVMMKLVGVFGALAALAVAFFAWYRENK